MVIETWLGDWKKKVDIAETIQQNRALETWFIKIDGTKKKTDFAGMNLQNMVFLQRSDFSTVINSRIKKKIQNEKRGFCCNDPAEYEFTNEIDKLKLKQKNTILQEDNSKILIFWI